ncbi:sugar phosphate isomerase/epimerase [Streptomyces sp. TLI_171]|uniref:sugar phosphate isomerase/epimerase family protein n=1 Tax=Streptomyces sp. TLI_171 TaxID=1938859 RepID=UPI000C18F288|nr:sugar phosphate isomerase/epimerase family protein [Streptomyces sp. TLI_171]RKE18445.1 sugar phosphate isomerase/epimerase [Streptomyces sp. TLI_171]
MPYAFSTLGLPGLPLPAVLGLAAESGWEGLELRAAPSEPVHTALSAAERRAAARLFTAAGIAPLAVASYVGIAEPGPDRPVTDDLLAHLHLAADLGAPYVRVFPRAGDTPPPEAGARAAARLHRLVDAADSLGVTVLIETHDSHRSGAALAELLDAVPHPAVGALWDVLHTWLAEESPADSHRHLAPRLGYVQVKDVASAADLTPLDLGAGVLPLADCLAPLAPDNWVSWEYEAPWHPAAAPLAPQLPSALARLSTLRPH